MVSAATTPLLDVLIIGGGPAGLSVATGLARQLYTAPVFDSGVYRNERARDDLLARYQTIQFENTKIESVQKTPEGYFQAIDVSGKAWEGRRLVLATGVRDLVPDIDGYDDCWGRGIYHCLFCHGYEEHGASSAGVLAIGDVGNVEVSLRLARMARRMTSNVTIYTNGAKNLSEQLVTALSGDVGIKVNERPITRLEKGPTEPKIIVHLADGSSITEGFLVHKPRTEINGPFTR